MSNFFTRDNLKRQSRVWTRKSVPGKLQIIPEEEPRPSCISSPSSSSSCSSSGHSYTANPLESSYLGPSIKARRRRATVKLSDIKVTTREAQLFPEITSDSSLSSSTSTLPRRAPRPHISVSAPPASPTPSFDSSKSYAIPSPDSFHLTFTDISFSFPHPPAPTRVNYYSDSDSSPSSESSGLPTTPTSSDDGLSALSCPKRTYNLPRRVSIKPRHVAKSHSGKPESFHHETFPNTHEQQHQKCTDHGCEVDDNDDAVGWYASQINQVLTLGSPYCDARRGSCVSVAPSSVLLPPSLTSPPPVSRPPPRTSLPTGFEAYDDDFDNEDNNDIESLIEDSVCLQEGCAALDNVVGIYDSITFDLDDVPLSIPLPGSPIDLDADPEELGPRTPVSSSKLKIKDSEKEREEREERERTEREKQAVIPATPVNAQGDEVRVLRSRWSVSTLASMKDERRKDSKFDAASKFKSKLYLGRARNSKPASPPVPAIPKRFSPMSPTKKQFYPPSPISPSYSDIMLIARQRRLRRSESRSSTSTNAGSILSSSASDSSAESSGSGLRRKPIPVEMFLRSATAA